MAKFTNGERHLVKGIVATLSLKRLSDKEIIESIFNQTNKMITDRALYDLRQGIKRDSYYWYNTLRQDQYAYIHEYKERVDELLSLQQMHHNIINNDREPTPVKQSSMVELHKLTITLSNLYDVASDIVSHASLSKISEDKATEQEPESSITV